MHAPEPAGVRVQRVQSRNYRDRERSWRLLLHLLGLRQNATERERDATAAALATSVTAGGNGAWLAEPDIR